jgi:hypothetical protein
MKKIFLILLIACSFSNVVEAQAPSLPYKSFGGDAVYHTLIDGAYILGTPYISDEWQKGVVLLENGSSFDNYLLKYDTYHQRLVFQSDKNAMEITDSIREFILEGKDSAQYHFINAAEYGKTDKPLFYEVLVEEKKGHLLKAHHKTITTTDRIINSVVQQSITPYDEYFYYDATSGKVVPVQLTAFSVISVLKLTQVQQDILHFSNYRFAEEDGLIRFFRNYLRNGIGN